MYLFIPRENIIDDRPAFANHVCDMVAKSHDFDYKKSVKAVKETYDYFFENVRNIYQFVDMQIPLFALYELSVMSQSDFDLMAEGEITRLEAEDRIIKACVEYYAKKQTR